MATYNQIISLINQSITSNGNEEISGQVMRSVLHQFADFIQQHAIASNNPHNVTKAQVGLGNVDNLTPDQILSMLTVDHLPPEVVNDFDLAVAIDNALAVIRDGVPTEGNTLNKLYEFVLAFVKTQTKDVPDETYNLQPADNLLQIHFTSPTGCDITIPEGFENGMNGTLVNKGEGILRFLEGGSMTIEAVGTLIERRYEAVKWIIEKPTVVGLYGPLVEAQ